MIFAQTVLFGWPIVVAILFMTLRPPVALLASIIAGYLLLPERLAFDLPLLPRLDKNSIPALAAFAIVLMARPVKLGADLAGWLPGPILPKLLLISVVAGAFLTVATNGEPITYGPTVLPALQLRDSLSWTLAAAITLLPLLLGRKYLAMPEQQKLLATALVAAGFIYAFLALYEVRMSPQLNRMVYGFFPHSWLQVIRGDGFRPLVFLQHGLWLAIFFSGTILAAFGMMRLAKGPVKYLYLAAGLWLVLTLILAKSLGAQIITLLLLPAVLFLKPGKQLLAGAIVAGIVLGYPVLRSANLVPTDKIAELAEAIDPRRAESFTFRLDNEDQLLARAQEKPLFGWGGWGRNLIFDERGREISITDGYWIIVIGQGGWFKYIGIFGLLGLPILIAALRARKYRLGLETSLLAIILAGNLIDLIPNATITPLTWLVAGALWGRLELRDLASVEKPAEQYSGNVRRSPLRYRRGPASAEAPEQNRAGHSPYTRQRNRIDRISDKGDG